jgi:hypothetical protein
LPNKTIGPHDHPKAYHRGTKRREHNFLEVRNKPYTQLLEQEQLGEKSILHALLTVYHRQRRFGNTKTEKQLSVVHNIDPDKLPAWLQTR